MKTVFSLSLSFFLLVFFSHTTTSYSQEKFAADYCGRFGISIENPVTCYIKLLGGGSEYRAIAIRALSEAGPKAAEAVPSLAKIMTEKEWATRSDLEDALVRIANGDDTSPAAKVYIKILAESLDTSQELRTVAMRGLSRIYNFQKLANPPSNPPGWLGLYPVNDFRRGRWLAPVISPNGKSYSQTVEDGEVGAMMQWFRKQTLMRDPSLAQKYSDEAIKTDTNPPKVNQIGKRRILFYDLTEKAKDEKGTTFIPESRSRTVVLLSNDKAIITEIFDSSVPQVRGKWHEPKFTAEDLTFWDRVEAALENPPRTNFRSSVELFKSLKKGMTGYEVWERVGQSDNFYWVGEGVGVETYQLLDDSTVILRYSYYLNGVRTNEQKGEARLDFASHDKGFHQRPAQVFIK